MFPRWPLSPRNLFQAASCRKLEPETPVAPWHEELHHIGESQSPRCQKMLQNCHWSYKIIKNCFLSNGTYWNILTTSYFFKKKTCVYIYMCIIYIYHIYIYTYHICTHQITHILPTLDMHQTPTGQAPSRSRRIHGQPPASRETSPYQLHVVRHRNNNNNHDKWWWWIVIIIIIIISNCWWLIISQRSYKWIDLPGYSYIIIIILVVMIHIHIHILIAMGLRRQAA